jgi:hypothetical protein
MAWTRTASTATVRATWRTSARGHYAPRPAGLQTPNILLVSIDALRPDHLGCMGYERDTSPVMDAFCRRSVRFRRVVAQSSRSIRSIPAVFTGRYPSQVAYGSEYLWPSLLRENQTFAEALRGGGYETAVTMGTDYFTRVDGFFQGFEQVNQIPEYRPARDRPVNEALTQLDRLQASERPWMLWVHLFKRPRALPLGPHAQPLRRRAGGRVRHRDHARGRAGGAPALVPGAAWAERRHGGGAHVRPWRGVLGARPHGPARRSTTRRSTPRS